MNEKMKEQMAEFLPPEEIEIVITNLELRREFMESVFSTIQENYGSVAAFLEQEFGMTPEKRA